MAAAGAEAPGSGVLAVRKGTIACKKTARKLGLKRILRLSFHPVRLFLFKVMI